MRRVQLKLLAAILFAGVSGSSANAQDTSSVQLTWELFVDRCGSFISDPAAFFQSQELLQIADWQWIIRAAENVGFAEYFSVSPDETQHVTAIGFADASSYSLHCSVSGGFSSGVTAESAMADVQRILDQSSHLSGTLGTVQFYGEAADIDALRQYYSTSALLRIEGVFEDTGPAVTVRIDDGEAFYIEVDTIVQN